MPRVARRNVLVLALAALLAPTLTVGCATGSHVERPAADAEDRRQAPLASPSTAEEAERAAALDGTSAEMPPSDPDVQRMVIRSGRIGLEAAEPAAAFDEAVTAVREAGGTILRSVEDDDAPRYGLRAKVPASRFEGVREALLGLGDAYTHEVDARDVTEEYVDLRARLDHARSVRDRYVALLDRAENVEEVLSVERELDRIQERIERLEGRLRYLRDHAAESRIDLTIVSPTHPGPVTAVLGGLYWVVEKLFVIG